MSSDSQGGAFKSYRDLTEEERAARAKRRALEYLDRPRLQQWTPDQVRLLDPGDGYWHLIADLMEEELKARANRARFRVV